MNQSLILLLLFFSFSLVGCQKPPFQEVRYIMGTLNEIKVNDLDRDLAKKAADLAFQKIDLVDQLMSHYKSLSEITQINRLLPLQQLKVSDETFYVLEKALELSRLSNGAFNINVGHLVELWGFKDKKWRETLPTKREVRETLMKSHYKKIKLNPESKEVEIAFGEASLDLGAIAKGYAVDLAIQELKEQGIQSAIVNSGGNLGFLGLPPEKTSWTVGIKNPKLPNQIIGTLSIKSGAVATSGNYENFFTLDGKLYSHIIDPRTGWPVQKMLSVTVVAPTAMDADALSTTLFVLGPKEGILLAKQFNAQALFIIEDTSQETGYRIEMSPGLERQFIKEGI